MDWKPTDSAIRLLNRRAIRRFEKASRQITQFDELNVMPACKKLYQDIAKDNQEVFLELAKKCYQDAEVHGKEKPDRAWLLALLAGYSAVTGYVYEHEIDRKRAYLEEGLLSRTNHKNEFRRALRYWSDMTYQYADDVTDSARIKAFTDAGVEQVQWHTAGDEKVCQVCRERNGEIYPIDNIPDKPHRKCRCWLTPV
jgi:SPP1 gp7 family putative phage head morphogenesis protein